MTPGERTVTTTFYEQHEPASLGEAQFFQRMPDGPSGELVIQVPMPHTVAPGTSGSGLRLAMVHDILHQRYPIHGKEWFQGRVDYNKSQVADILSDDSRPSERELLRLDTPAPWRTYGCMKMPRPKILCAKNCAYSTNMKWT